MRSFLDVLTLAACATHPPLADPDAAAAASFEQRLAGETFR